MTFARIAAVTFALMLAGPTMAQTQRAQLDYATAAKVRDTCIAWASERGLSVSIAVFNDAGVLVTSAHMDGTATAIADVAQWKGKSAATYRFPSAVTAGWGGPAPGMANWGGGVPFVAADGTPLGGIGVSGAETEDDIACGLAGIAAAGMKPGNM
ncbi:MAG TPA: heme-binding protein [Erythrobacter sp.]|nr:heme-binding protein [Erythrobacter sp.]